MRIGTVCFIEKDDSVMLVLIKYGENDEKWNGIGGIVEDGEILEDALIREIKEEVGVDVKKKDLRKMGVLTNEELELNVFLTEKWEGKPRLLDKSFKKIGWFKKDELPFDKMWEGNEEWLPKILNREFISGRL